MTNVFRKYIGVSDEFLDKSKEDVFTVIRKITSVGNSATGKFLYLTTSGLRWLKELFCFPKTDLVQALTTINDTSLVDAIGIRDGINFRGRGYEFNGTDNYLEFSTGFNVGDILTYTKTDNTTATVNLDANKRAFDGVAIRIFNYEINGYIFNCEEGALGVSYSTTPGITASINGTIAGFHVNDDRKTTCKLNTHGYSTCDSLPGVAIPLDDNYEPVITCV